MAALARAGRDKLTFVIEPDLAPLGAWLEQLIAESTGKQGVGIVPVDGETLGAPEVYGDDRVFVRLGPASDSDWHSEVDAKLDALAAAGHPLIDIRLDDASWVAAEFFRWEFATAVAGIGLGVNPFDEPNVTESKENTARCSRSTPPKGACPSRSPRAARGPLAPGTAARRRASETDFVELLREHLARVPENGYFQIGAYIAPTERAPSCCRRCRRSCATARGKATTLGYGPRFLHSTGQLHKGGAPSGCFIQLTNGHPVDLDIPGRDESFGVLIDAQAMGDLAAFGAHDLPALRIDLGDDPEAGLSELLAAFAEALA